MQKEFTNKKGQVCGWIGEDGNYRKNVDSRKHKLRIMDAYGIDEDIVQELIKEGVKEIRIRETDTGVILSTSMENYMEHSVTRNFESLQRFLSKKYFETNENALLTP